MPPAFSPPGNRPPQSRFATFLPAVLLYPSHRSTAVHQLPLNHSFHRSTVPSFHRSTGSIFFIPAAIMIA